MQCCGLGRGNDWVSNQVVHNVEDYTLRVRSSELVEQLRLEPEQCVDSGDFFVGLMLHSVTTKLNPLVKLACLAALKK